MRCLIFVAIALLAACSRSNDTSAATAAADASAAAARAATAERIAMFGTAAEDPAIVWAENGLGSLVIDAGQPPKPGIGDTVRIFYTGRLKDGSTFDQPRKTADFQIGRTILGLSTGLQSLGAHGKAMFFIPPSLGYGARKVAGIPPNSGLIFAVEVVAINP